MRLSAGTRLGVYEVAAAIGAGGMGEVYRARDTKLNRDVALKILPESLAADSDRISRFREAQLLAALNHGARLRERTEVADADEIKPSRRRMT
jgi:serine/threonine protein kinase